MEKYLKKLSCIVVLALLFCIGCKPKSITKDANEPPSAPVTKQAPAVKPAEPAAAVEIKPAKAVSPNEVAVTVNGKTITEGEINELIKPQLDRMLENARRRNMPENFLNDAKKQLHDQGVEAAIFNKLIEGDIAKHNIIITDEEVNKHIEELAAQQDMTVDDLKTLIESNGQDFDQWKKRMQFDTRIAVNKLIEINGLGSTGVTEEEVLNYYKDNPETFETPEQVRASHILIKPDNSVPNITEQEADSKAKEKAENLLKQIKDGADFAELAKANSDCPSSQEGGDLGFASKRDWVEPFSEVAFALEPNKISDVVPTRFGYHIIKVTDRKQAGKKAFDEVKKGISDMLKTQKQQTLITKYFETLKSKATIVYPEGKEPIKQSQL